MKCKFCGAKIKKSDEICPDCGKYLSKESASEAYKEDSESVSMDPLGKNIKFYECKDFGSDVRFFCVSRAIFALIFIVAGAYNLHDWIYPVNFTKFYLIVGLLILLCIAAVIAGIIAYLVCKKSFICINENGVYGIRPKFFVIPERFSFYYNEITDFHCHIPVAKGIPVVTVITQEKTFRIYGLSNANASFLASYTRENMPSKKEKRRKRK